MYLGGDPAKGVLTATGFCRGIEVEYRWGWCDQVCGLYAEIDSWL